MIINYQGRSTPKGIKAPAALIQVNNAEEIIRIAVAMRREGSPGFEEMAIELLQSLLLHVGEDGYEAALLRAGYPLLSLNAEELGDLA